MADSSDTGVTSARVYSARPTFTVEGTVQPSLGEALLWLEVSDDDRGMSRLEARFENWGSPPGGGAPGFMFFDGATIDFGKKVELAIGATDASATVFTGRVTSIGGSFGSTNVPEFSFSAEDSLMLLRMTRRTHTWEDVKDSDVAQQIAQQHNFQADADADGPHHKVLVQLGQSDLAFLRERAEAIDAHVWMEGDTLKFKARNSRSSGDKIQLTLGDALRRFHVLGDLSNQVAEVHVHGVDVSAKQNTNGNGQSSLLSSESNGAPHTGADILQRSFGARVEHIVDRAPATPEEARAMAEAELKARGRSFVRCRGETEGTATMKVGSLLKIAGVGPVFSGTYYATLVMHRYDRIAGFKTMFEGERPAIGEES
jgi:phage protein D